MLLAVLIVLVGEGDLSIFRLFQLVVGNGDPMRVAAQLIQYLFGTAKWRLHEARAALERAMESQR